MTEGSTFNSNPGRSPRFLGSWVWYERIDAAIHGGRLHFILNKKWVLWDRGRVLVIGPNHWFDQHCWDDLRRGKYARPGKSGL